MPIINDQKADLLGKSRQPADGQAEADEETAAEASGPAIELADLTTGPEAEVNRLKSIMIALSAEISQIRSEHVGLVSDYQQLTGELRDIKLVLAKVHAKELRAIERCNSWMQSLRLLREMFRKSPNRGKNQGSRNRVSFLGK